MCGIAGVVELTEAKHRPADEQLAAMVAALSHRGPDEFGLYRDERAVLLHARLSILDLSAGQQPMAHANGRLWISFNGEIYNYIELREQLRALGHAFRTHSDTEVALCAYAQWGAECFARFNGQWAIAIWDAQQRELVLSRDHFGIAPLYVCEQPDRVIFASEVKAIFALDETLPRAFDPLGLEQTFTFWSIIPPQGIFKGISELRPGHYRIYRNGAATEHAYWQPRFPTCRAEEFAGSLDAAVAALHDTLQQATRLRMQRADVPVGSYLSGGLDSSLVAALGKDARPDTFHTFSMRFEDAEYDETDYQREMAARLGSRHAELLITRADIAAALPEVIEHTERPILRTAPVPLFLLSRRVRAAGIKVVLTGEGADEVFAGYDIFREAKVRRFWARFPQSEFRPMLLNRLYPYLSRSPVGQQAMARRFFGKNLDQWDRPGFSHALRWSTTASIKRFYSEQQRQAVAGSDVIKALLDELPAAFKQWSYLSQDQYLEMVSLLSGYLLSSQGDRMLMAHSVEGRFPYLDINVVEFANALPARYKLKVLDEKHVLKQCAAAVIPPRILARKKQPYRAPDALAFIGAERPPGWLEELMESDSVQQAGVFNEQAVGQLWRKCRNFSGQQFSNADNMALIGIMSTQLLYERFIRRRPAANPRVNFTTHHDLTVK
ncbi:MAG: asparagine synthase (glutamine-hydrolyzing) [Pseudomonadota bacterium]